MITGPASNGRMIAVNQRSWPTENGVRDSSGGGSAELRCKKARRNSEFLARQMREIFAATRLAEGEELETNILRVL
jgi:hypothetical protein